MSEKLQNFYSAAQIGLQEHIHQVLRDIDPLVEDAGASLGDLSFCFGSVFASILFELVRGDDEFVMSEEQKNFAIGAFATFSLAFNEKLELLCNPDLNKLEVKFQ